MKRKAALFTIVQNEPVFLPVWARYYRQHFPVDDIFVLDHDSSDSLTVRAAREFHRVPVHREVSFDHGWLRDTVKRFQAFLLESYDLVLFTEVDEIVAADPELYPGGLAEFLCSAIDADTSFLRCTGYEIVHDRRRREAPIDWSRAVVAQRSYCRRSLKYSKPLLSRCALDWGIGFHHLATSAPALPDPDPRLLLLHLHRADFETCWSKTLENAARHWSTADVDKGAGRQNRIVDEQAFEQWFYSDFFDKELYSLQPIPASWTTIV